MSGDTPQMPECEKIVDSQDRSRVLSDFVDWLRGEKIQLCRYEKTKDECPTCGEELKEENLYPIRENYEELFARYLGIDLKKVEVERRALLATLGDRT